MIPPRPLPTDRPVTLRDVIGPRWSDVLPSAPIRIAMNRLALAARDAERRASVTRDIVARLAALEARERRDR